MIVSQPIIMGVLNVKHDSFSDGGKFFDANSAIDQASSMVRKVLALLISVVSRQDLVLKLSVSKMSLTASFRLLKL